MSNPAMRELLDLGRQLGIDGVSSLADQSETREEISERLSFALQDIAISSCQLALETENGRNEESVLFGIFAIKALKLASRCPSLGPPVWLSIFETALVLDSQELKSSDLPTPVRSAEMFCSFLSLSCFFEASRFIESLIAISVRRSMPDYAERTVAEISSRCSAALPTPSLTIFDYLTDDQSAQALHIVRRSQLFRGPEGQKPFSNSD